MYTYTMTFVDNDSLALPKDNFARNAYVKNEVLKMLTEHQLQLADFNWSDNYNPEHTKSYLERPYYCNTVVEIRQQLDMNIITSREAIYERCLIAMKNDELYVKKSIELEDTKSQKVRSLISFDIAS